MSVVPAQNGESAGYSLQDLDSSLLDAICKSLPTPIMVVGGGTSPTCVVSKGFLDLWLLSEPEGPPQFSEVCRACREQLRDPAIFDAVVTGLTGGAVRLELLNGKTRQARPEVLFDTDGKPLGRMLYFWDHNAQRLLHLVQEKKHAAVRRLSNLSGREHEVADLIFLGRTNKAIALNKGISVKTVEKHRARLMQKLGAESVADLIRALTLAKLGEDLDT